MPRWFEDALVLLYYVWVVVFFVGSMIMAPVDGRLFLALLVSTIVAGVAMKLAGWLPE